MRASMPRLRIVYLRSDSVKRQVKILIIKLYHVEKKDTYKILDIMSKITTSSVPLYGGAARGLLGHNDLPVGTAVTALLTGSFIIFQRMCTEA